jgi:hypothetical protein
VYLEYIDKDLLSQLKYNMSGKKSPAKEPVPSANIPNGYDANPMMMEALHSITPYNLPMFLLSNP